MMSNMYDIPHIRSRLESVISGVVESAVHYTRYYSVDASSYTILPDIIVIPKDQDDISSAVMVAKETKIPITPRGGGTGLVGGALNCGIILDMQNLSDVKISSNNVTVGAGITKGRLDDTLNSNENHYKSSHTTTIFAPNPSVGPFCTIGGMIANNAAGSQSLKYGCTIDNVNSITMIDGTGNIVKLPEDTTTGYKILDIAKHIEIEKFPRVSKNASGYRLDAVNTIQDTHKVLVGSEGTLGIITSAELKTIKRSTSRQLYILQYTSIADAISDCIQITADHVRPTAVEFVDKVILDNIEYEFKKQTVCLLFVEYEKLDDYNEDNDDDNNTQNYANNNTTKHTTNTNNAAADSKYFASSVAINAIDLISTTDNEEITRWWRYRDSALHYSLVSIKNNTDEKHVPHVIEDATVPTQSLPALFASLQTINQKYGTRTITYGHVGNGNIHVRLVCQKNSTNKILQKITAEYFERVFALNGSMTGEHGDGLARSGFVAAQYGQKNLKQFILLKELFDPTKIMNPGKIITDKTGIL